MQKTFRRVIVRCQPFPIELLYPLIQARWYPLLVVNSPAEKQVPDFDAQAQNSSISLSAYQTLYTHVIPSYTKQTVH